MEKTRLFLEKMGIKGNYGLIESQKRFDDGAQYRFEVPGIQKPGALHSLIDAMDEFEVNVHRVTQTKGIMLLTDSEIEDMNQMAIDAQMELFLSVGPRATYDTSASAQTKEGARIGYRLRGYDNLIYAIEDVKRAVNLGVRGIVIYDEGLLWVLNKMRLEGELPENVHFKISAHTGHGNPASAQLLEQLGANSFNPVRDLQINMISAIRQSLDISIDLHTENPKSSGGFIRHYEAPDIIKVAAPVYLKTGGAVAGHHGWDTTEVQAGERIKQVYLVQSMINRYYPDAKISKR
ncbi:U32 family peptidase [Methanobacterium alcaliphilum]|uniref:U32 family peptidase n=1 Tax=Methanobacterium alcaliphilum TaxID=392018 RepID=UPI00200AA0B7|nr:U32 family peptidase [Methanobacterium alcaliphilum]MCK9150991.1 U32 family peptidase [Methanobacterium alcaliphilum]